MKRFFLLTSALALAATVLVLGGPAAESAQARTCWKAQHPDNRSYGIACNDGRFTSCDAQRDGRDTWLRIWALQPSAPGSKSPKPVPKRAPGSNRDGFVPENSYSSAHDIFGYRDRHGRRSPRYCTPGAHPGFGISAISVCVSRQGCSRPLPLHTAKGRID